MGNPPVAFHHAGKGLESGGSAGVSVRDSGVHWTRCSCLALWYVSTGTPLPFSSRAN